MQYSLLVRDIEWEVTDVCSREGIGLLPWSPLKGGHFLSPGINAMIFKMFSPEKMLQS
jgi:aryl-alcohol dehydrogenase-like predicted oxidoreductase